MAVPSLLLHIEYKETFCLLQGTCKDNVHRRTVGYITQQRRVCCNTVVGCVWNKQQKKKTELIFTLCTPKIAWPCANHLTRQGRWDPNAPRTAYSLKKYKNDRTRDWRHKAASLSQQSDTEGHKSSADHLLPLSKTHTVECTTRGAEHTDLWSVSNHSGTLPAGHANIRGGREIPKRKKLGRVPFQEETYVLNNTVH